MEKDSWTGGKRHFIIKTQKIGKEITSMKRFFKENWLVIVTGVVVGIAALLLQALGNGLSRRLREHN